MKNLSSSKNPYVLPSILTTRLKYYTQRLNYENYRLYSVLYVKYNTKCLFHIRVK